MNKLPYTPFEIKELYKNAQNPKKQIRILAQLCRTTENRIIRELQNQGVDIRAKRNIKAQPPPQAGKRDNLPTGVIKVGGKYRSRYFTKGQTFYLGSFDTAEEAAEKTHRAREADNLGWFEEWFADDKETRKKETKR